MPQTSHLSAETNDDEAISRLSLHVSGTVQGVGFRPFVYNLAGQLNLTGWVRNDIRGLYIEVEGSHNLLGVFLQRLQDEAPSIAEITQIDQAELKPRGETGFRIAASENLPEAQPKPSVLPDLASCPDCLKETRDPDNRRYRYPFTSCTLCGPRWSIIEALPYDRPNTGMRGFPFCPDCEREYTSPADRRFHHQANTCPVCGPQLAFQDRAGVTLATQEAALQAAITSLRQGRIVALKGIGGFQLLADACNEGAVSELRRRKRRPAKPFALLCSDLVQISAYCDTDPAEIDLLQSPATPIVLLKKKPDTGLAESIAPGNPYLGVMLPVSVLHHLLANEFGGALICTSGNVSGDPICKDNNEALERLQHIADLFLLHDRPVIRALDDSVAQIVFGRPALLRRARGYTPRPVSVKAGGHSSTVLAVGAHIKNTVALSLPAENQATEIMLSAHLGDLDAISTRSAFTDRITKYQALYRLAPRLVVHDLHPDYYSTQYAIDSGIKKLAVQHHWAHIVACMAEHRLDRPVLGIAWDGVGLGDDGNAWGGEFMLADAHSYRRLGHLLPFVLPGGDAAAKDSRRAMLGALYTAAGGNLPQVQQWLPPNVFTESELRTFVSMLQGEVNTVLTTSAGRLFDAVSSLLGLCQRNTFEGEGAMLLQFAAEAGSVDSTQSLPQLKNADCAAIDWRPLLRLIIEKKHAGESINNLARLFHQTLVKVIVDFAVNMPDYAVVLTGGCFQNRLLLQLAIEALQQQQIEVYWPQQIPANDGGVAFGQAVIGVNHFSNIATDDCMDAGGRATQEQLPDPRNYTETKQKNEKAS